MNASAIAVTALYAGIFGLFAVLLANFVLWVRLKGAEAPEWQRKVALRVQGNFIENVPIALILLLVLELQGIAAAYLHGCGLALLVLRCLHAYGFGLLEGANYPRFVGAQGTFVLISIMAVAALASALV